MLKNGLKKSKKYQIRREQRDERRNGGTNAVRINPQMKLASTNQDHQSKAKRKEKKDGKKITSSQIFSKTKTDRQKYLHMYHSLPPFILCNQSMSSSLLFNSLSRRKPRKIAGHPRVPFLFLLFLQKFFLTFN